MLSKKEIAQRLHALSEEMLDVGVEMNYYGGLSPMAQHGIELVGAGHVAQSWARAIEEELNG